MFSTKLVYTKDDLAEWYENEIMSCKWQIAMDIPQVYRMFMLRVLLRLIPDGYLFILEKINEEQKDN